MPFRYIGIEVILNKEIKIIIEVYSKYMLVIRLILIMIEVFNFLCKLSCFDC